MKKISEAPAAVEPNDILEIYRKRACEILMDVDFGGSPEANFKKAEAEIAKILRENDLERAKSLKARIAALLLEVSSGAEARTIRLRGEDMATMLGARRTTISTTLSEWKRLGLIVGFGQKLQVVGIKALEKIAKDV